jgi:hypothetical protein
MLPGSGINRVVEKPEGNKAQTTELVDPEPDASCHSGCCNRDSVEREYSRSRLLLTYSARNRRRLADLIETHSSLTQASAEGGGMNCTVMLWRSSGRR